MRPVLDVAPYRYAKDRPCEENCSISMGQEEEGPGKWVVSGLAPASGLWLEMRLSPKV